MTRKITIIPPDGEKASNLQEKGSEQFPRQWLACNEEIILALRHSFPHMDDISLFRELGPRIALRILQRLKAQGYLRE